MNTIQKIKRLAKVQKEAELLAQQIKEEQRSCKHSWGEVEHEAIEEPIYGYYRDSYSSYCDSRYLKSLRIVNQWTRRCTKCNTVETTQKEKCVKTAPDFGD